MANSSKTSSAGFLYGFAGLFVVLVTAFDPALAYVLTLLVMVVGIILIKMD